MAAPTEAATMLLMQGKYTEAIRAIDVLLATEANATPQLLCSRAMAHLGECLSMSLW
jgi:hypothetical protein